MAEDNNDRKRERMAATSYLITCPLWDAGHYKSAQLRRPAVTRGKESVFGYFTMNEHHLGAVFEDQVSNPTVGQCDTH